MSRFHLFKTSLEMSRNIRQQQHTTYALTLNIGGYVHTWILSINRDIFKIYQDITKQESQQGEYQDKYQYEQYCKTNYPAGTTEICRTNYPAGTTEV